MLSTPRELSELEQANAQVVAVGGMLSTVSIETIELGPSLGVGYDRVNAVLEFLKTSQGQDFRVIAIHGPAGVGKTTLLHHVWNNEHSRKLPFRYAAAYVVGMGPAATDSTICDLQFSIWRQLGGGEDEVFPHADSGRAKLDKHFQQLQTQGKPLFLTIDNVLDVSDLQRLLPHKLWSGNLSTSSCIVLTCRNFSIVEALARICGLKLSDADRVLCFEPQPFDIQESRMLFAQCAGMQDSASQHLELLDALVSLCGGHPLALTLLGRIFRNERKRHKTEWQLIQATFHDDDGDDVTSVMKALQVSFAMLTQSCQIAFLDMVSMFCGWPWERVERIVSARIMRDLLTSALIQKVDDVSNYKGSALRWGYGWRCYKNLRKGCFVSMHDLTLRFGERILCKNDLDYRTYVKPPTGHHLSTLKHLIMSENSDALELIQQATGLQTLALLQHYEIDGQTSNYTRLGEDFFQASSCNESSRYANQLRHLMLHGCKWSRSILEMKVLQELRELILKGCGNLVQLPNTPLNNLEVLEINDCPEFRGFSASCVEEWGRLKDFYLRKCPCITIIPEDFGRLPSLRGICIKECTNLEKFPSLRRLEGPSSLTISNCPRLHTLGDMFCPLESLEMIDLPAVTKLPSLRSLDGPSSLTISRCPRVHTLGGVFCPLESKASTSLQTLFITACDGLVQLVPEEEITNMVSLLKLSLVECRGLGRLPAGIFRTAAISLIVLNLEGCENLVKLPHEIGGLRFLEELCLRGCKKLEKLPDSIASVSSLRTLHLGQCESLTELPQQIGGLCSLKKLTLCKCRKLDKLPDSIASITSLEALHLDECESLTELPQQIGGLCSLRKLSLCECRKLDKLPDSIASITSLEALHLDDCERLTELPKQIGSLRSLRQLDLRACKLEELPDSLASITSLETLNLGGFQEFPRQVGGLCSLKLLALSSCPQLEKLPKFLGSIRSLEVLSLCECESLTQLPQEIGGLCCLEQLSLQGCIKLEKLPDSITNITSLQVLELECESLTELPQEMGGLCSLKQLSLHGCNKLVKLPDSISNIMSLEALELECESLTELPQEMGGLCSLKQLSLHGCNKLVKLPDSITNITSLEALELECESLTELPQQMQGLCSLKKLSLKGCKKLQELPISITSISSLKDLIVENCGGLVEIEEMRHRLPLACCLRVIVQGGAG